MSVPPAWGQPGPASGDSSVSGWANGRPANPYLGSYYGAMPQAYYQHPMTAYNGVNLYSYPNSYAANPYYTATPTPTTSQGITTSSVYTLEQAQYYWQHMDYYQKPPLGWPPPPFPRPSQATPAEAKPAEPPAPEPVQTQEAQPPPPPDPPLSPTKLHMQPIMPTQPQEQNTAQGQLQASLPGMGGEGPLMRSTAQGTGGQDPVYVNVKKAKKKRAGAAAWREVHAEKMGKAAVGTSPLKVERVEEDKKEDDAMPAPFQNFITRAYTALPASEYKALDGFMHDLYLEHVTRGTLKTHDWEGEGVPSVSDLLKYRNLAKKKKKKRKGVSSVACETASEKETSNADINPAKKKKKRHLGMVLVNDEEEMSKRANRARRFEMERPKTPVRTGQGGEEGGFEADGIDWKEEHIVGTCTDLEKPYLRLTSRPEPHTVRPCHVLEKALCHVKEGITNGRDYHYVCEQLKSLRQDLTIQSIRNELAVDVYETHARVALTNNDLSEFNQCQTQLISLYEIGLPGEVAEFAAYRILYQLYTQCGPDLLLAMDHLSPSARRNTAVCHAFDVMRAVNNGNYHRFFALFQKCPNLGCAIMRHLVPRMRQMAYRVIMKAYAPNPYPVDVLASELQFESVDECVRYLLTDCRARLNDTFTQVLTSNKR